jgi:hypothetical protein
MNYQIKFLVVFAALITLSSASLAQAEQYLVGYEGAFYTGNIDSINSSKSPKIYTIAFRTWDGTQQTKLVRESDLSPLGQPVKCGPDGCIGDNAMISTTIRSSTQYYTLFGTVMEAYANGAGLIKTQYGNFWSPSIYSKQGCILGWCEKDIAFYTIGNQTFSGKIVGLYGTPHTGCWAYLSTQYGYRLEQVKKLYSFNSD